MSKILIMDKDGSAIPFPPRYIDHVAEFLANETEHPDEVQESYEEFKRNAVIGAKYDPKSLQPDGDEGVVLSGSPDIAVLPAKRVEPDLSVQQYEVEIMATWYERNGVPRDRFTENLMSHYSNIGIVTSCPAAYPLPEEWTLSFVRTNVKKGPDLEHIVDSIGRAFDTEPADMVWLEDSLTATQRLNELDIGNIVYRKNPEFNYVDHDRMQKRYGVDTIV